MQKIPSQKIIIGLLIAVAVVLVAFLLKDKVMEMSDDGSYENDEVGLSFTYEPGADGYVLEEFDTDGTLQDLKKILVLMEAESAVDVTDIPASGEAPPSMTILVFDNPAKATPQQWADSHTEFSNTHLKMGDITETIVDGSPAIRYMADGLYASENVIVAKGEYVYLIRGMYIDETSSLRADFAPLVQSIKLSAQE